VEYVNAVDRYAASSELTGEPEVSNLGQLSGGSATRRSRLAVISNWKSRFLGRVHDCSRLTAIRKLSH